MSLTFRLNTVKLIPSCVSMCSFCPIYIQLYSTRLSSTLSLSYIKLLSLCISSLRPNCSVIFLPSVCSLLIWPPRLLPPTHIKSHFPPLFLSQQHAFNHLKLIFRQSLLPSICIAALKPNFSTFFSAPPLLPGSISRREPAREIVRAPSL